MSGLSQPLGMVVIGGFLKNEKIREKEYYLMIIGFRVKVFGTIFLSSFKFKNRNRYK